jgi:Ion channel/Cobalt transport protein
MHEDQRHSVIVDNRLRLIHAWQGRVRNPSLTILLILELCAIFLAAPLAAKGLPIARAVADALLLAVLVIVVMLSHRWGAIIMILLGLTAIATSLLLGGEWSPVSITVLRRGGDILTFSALTWVVGHAVYAPGRITSQRLQGAVVLYLSLATIFASVYGLIWELNPSAFANLVTPVGGPKEVATMLYFSLTTLTTTGYGDIVAVDPFARSLANFEAIVGQFYLAITVARLVTLELGDRRR